MKKPFLFTAFFLIVSLSLLAQTEKYGIWTSVGLDKRLKKWNLSAETEFRTQDCFSLLTRWSLELDAQYSIFKKLKVGAGYQFQNFYDEKYNDYQPRNRFSLFITGKQKLGMLTFALREKLQVTTKDESDRIKSSGKIDTYKINPAWYWRNRFKVEYNIPKFPINPSFSVETFYQLNNPDGNNFDNLRYILGLGYNLNKLHHFELYGLYDHNINVTDPVRRYVAGIAYTYSFK